MTTITDKELEALESLLTKNNFEDVLRTCIGIKKRLSRDETEKVKRLQTLISDLRKMNVNVEDELISAARWNLLKYNKLDCSTEKTFAAYCDIEPHKITITFKKIDRDGRTLELYVKYDSGRFTVRDKYLSLFYAGGYEPHEAYEVPVSQWNEFPNER